MKKLILSFFSLSFAAAVAMAQDGSQTAWDKNAETKNLLHAIESQYTKDAADFLRDIEAWAKDPEVLRLLKVLVNNNASAMVNAISDARRAKKLPSHTDNALSMFLFATNAPCASFKSRVDKSFFDMESIGGGLEHARKKRQFETERIITWLKASKKPGTNEKEKACAKSIATRMFKRGYIPLTTYKDLAKDLGIKD